jgi:hypothetical protein
VANYWLKWGAIQQVTRRHRGYEESGVTRATCARGVKEMDLSIQLVDSDAAHLQAAGAAIYLLFAVWNEISKVVAAARLDSRPRARLNRNHSEIKNLH